MTIERKLLYSGPPEGLFEYEHFRQFMFKRREEHGDVECVSLSNNNDSTDIIDAAVKDQVYHCLPGVTVFWDDRFSPSKGEDGRHSMVFLYGKKEDIQHVEEIVRREAEKYASKQYLQ